MRNSAVVNRESLETCLSNLSKNVVFREESIDEEKVDALLKQAHNIPSTFYLQPISYVTVTEKKTKKKLQKAALKNQAVEKAPLIVVLVADRKVETRQIEPLADHLSMSDDQKESFKSKLDFCFDKGFGFLWLVKGLLAPFIRFFTPLPVFPAVHKRYFLGKKAMLSSMALLLAAEVEGLSSQMIDIIDEKRVRKALKIPSSYIIPGIICLGYPQDEKKPVSKLPLSGFVHKEVWKRPGS